MARAAAPQIEDEEGEEKAAAKGGGMPSTKIILIAVIAMGFMMFMSVGLIAFFALRGASAHDSAADGADDTAAAADQSDQHAAAKGKQKSGAEKEKKEKEKKQPAQYLDLSPAFVVNLQDDQAMRYLQIEVQLMTRDPKAVEEIKNNMPRIRNTLMLLFAQQHAKDLVTREAKEALQQQALEQVQQAMKDETGSADVEAVYFTNFVMQ
jgi:flagellar FliL protein